LQGGGGVAGGKPMASQITQWGKYGYGRAVTIAYALGIALGLGVGLALFSSSLVDFGLYLISMSVFHLWEYMYVCIYHPTDLSAESFMVTHSKSFHIALAACVTEYFFEWIFFPSLKGHTFIYVIGFIAVVLGQGLRTVAMITAAQNFSHIIAEKKDRHASAGYAWSVRSGATSQLHWLVLVEHCHTSCPWQSYLPYRIHYRGVEFF